MTLTSLTLIVIAAGPGELVPSGNPESVSWGKKDTGYVFGVDKTLTLEVMGPNNVVLELRGSAALKGKNVAVDILRDDSAQSKNSLVLRLTPGGPEKLRFASKLGFKVADGKHRLVIHVDVEGMAMHAVEAKNVPKPILAADEEPVAKRAVAAASASVSEPVPAAVVKPAPTPAPAAPVTEEQKAVAAAMIHEANRQVMGTDEGDTASAAESGKPSTGPLRVAVYDLDLQGIDGRVGAVVTDSLLAEVRKLQSVSAIGMAEIRDMLSMEASKQMVGCSDNESCLAEIAGALGVDDLLTGALSKVGDGNVLVLRRLDQRQGKIRGTVNQRLKAGAGDEFLLAIGPAVQELFPERELKVGKERGVAKEVALRINPPPLPKWSFYAIAGGAVAAAAAGGVLELLAQDKASQFRNFAGQGVNNPSGISGKTLVGYGDEATSRADQARYTFIGSGVFALAAGVVAFFTDWYGYGEVQAPPR
jgi:hypothetical protein